MSNFAGLYSVRDYRPSDEGFIYSTFLAGNYYGHSWFKLVPQDIFMSSYRKVVDHFVTTALIKVACLPDDPDTIIGYSILSPDFQTLHWVHVKKTWRGHGVAKALTPAHPQTVSHLNDLGKTLLPKLNGAIFNPFKLT